MLRLVLTLAVFAGGLLAACASEGPQPARPEVQALSRMAQECQAREASALVQGYALQAKLEAETKRADDAEAKLKGPASAGAAPH